MCFCDHFLTLTGEKCWTEEEQEDDELLDWKQRLTLTVLKHADGLNVPGGEGVR